MIPFLIGLFIWLAIGAVVSGIYDRLEKFSDPGIIEIWVAIVLWPLDAIQIIYKLARGSRK